MTVCIYYLLSCIFLKGWFYNKRCDRLASCGYLDLVLCLYYFKYFQTHSSRVGDLVNGPINPPLPILLCYLRPSGCRQPRCPFCSLLGISNRVTCYEKLSECELKFYSFNKHKRRTGTNNIHSETAIKRPEM